MRVHYFFIFLFLQLELLIRDVRQVIGCGTKESLRIRSCRAVDGGVSNTKLKI